MENDLFNSVFDKAAHLNIPAVVIGGLALPAFQVAGLNLDIDICVRVGSQEILNQFINALQEVNILTYQNSKIEHDLFTVYGKNTKAVIWFKPCDAFTWDDQMVERIKKYINNVYVVVIEDFILTKLARGDRSHTDIDDIMQILIANKDDIDRDYLKFDLDGWN